jgi:hypothetical protein
MPGSGLPHVSCIDLLQLNSRFEARSGNSGAPEIMVETEDDAFCPELNISDIQHETKVVENAEKLLQGS